MSEKYTLYGAPLSLYTGKARAYLTYKQVPYEEVFSSLKVYKTIIVPNTGVRFIPVLKTPQGEYIQDTVAIIDTLESDFPQRSITPTGPLQHLVSEIFQIWADEWLVIPAMHYRWNHDNFPFIYEEFGRIVAPNMPKFIRRFLGKKVGAKFKGFVPILGITDKSIPAIEDWYENHVLVELDKHFSQHDYLLGARPCAGDFGLMGPLYAHLYRDPSPGAMMRSKTPNVARWVERMNMAPAKDADWLPDDTIPVTLEPLLKRILAEFWPVLLGTLKHTQQWIKDNPQKAEIPRTVGEHEYQIGGVTEKRAIMTFHQWKLQRINAVFEAFSDQQKAQINAFFTPRFGVEIQPLDISQPVKRVNNKLVVADSSEL